MIFKTNGFPTTISDHIDLPPIEDLLLMPFMIGIPVEDARKYGTEFQKYLIDKTPLSNKKKYIYIQMIIKYLTPSVSPVINDYATDQEWHVDANGLADPNDVIFHLMVNKTTSMTDFNTTPFEVEVESPNELIKRIHTPGSLESKLLVPKQIESNKIITFDNTHIHRANRTSKPEFRFIYRVIESNIEKPTGDPQIGVSYVFNGGRKPIINIKQHIGYGKVQKIDIFKE